MSRRYATAFWACLAGQVFAGPSFAAAITLDMPAPASVIGGWSESPSSLRLPIGPFADDKIPLREADGAVSQRAYRMDDQRLTTLQLISPLLSQLRAAGYTILYQCETSACGGFDFRYGMDVLPEPQMHVDLGDFRYVAAERTDQNGPDLIALLVSRSDDSAFVQVTTIAAVSLEHGVKSAQMVVRTTDGVSALPAAQPTTPALAPSAQGNIGTALFTQGSVALDDLLFPSGAAALEDKDYASLTELALWLKANPTRSVTLVGHTDAVGSLPSNIALSLQRAQSVRAALIAKLGADPARVDAQGAGYLAPRASNETAEGRTKNRRVEVILTPTP
ncbi:MAG: OmpA family protein [Cypionkella sp.]